MGAQAIAAKTRIRGLDGLRGISALMIFFYHAWGRAGFPKVTATIGRYPAVDLTSYVQFSGQGFAILFVLSGFLLSLPFWRELQGGPAVRWSHFVRRRLLRIYPAYLIVVLLLALVYDVAHPLSARVIMLASHLLLLHNLTEATIYSISAPLWSVATQFQLYVTLPLIFLILKKHLTRGTALPRLLVGLFVVSGSIGVLFLWATNASLAHLAVDPRLVVAHGRVLLHSPIIALARFCAGVVAGYFYVVLAQAGQTRGRRSLWWDITFYATILVLPSLSRITSGRIYGLSPTGWPVVPLLFAFLVLATSQSTEAWGGAAVLEAAPLRHLGTVSYSFYLWHDFVLWMVWNRLSGMSSGMLANDAARTGCALVITTVVAWLSCQLLELRFGRIIARLWDRASERILASGGRGA